MIRRGGRGGADGPECAHAASVLNNDSTASATNPGRCRDRAWENESLESRVTRTVAACESHPYE
jgi:hypothetical protein